MDVFIDRLLREERVCDIQLPRLQVGCLSLDTALCSVVYPPRTCGFGSVVFKCGYDYKRSLVRMTRMLALSGLHAPLADYNDSA